MRSTEKARLCSWMTYPFLQRKRWGVTFELTSAVPIRNVRNKLNAWSLVLLLAAFLWIAHPNNLHSTLCLHLSSATYSRRVRLMVGSTVVFKWMTYLQRLLPLFLDIKLEQQCIAQPNTSHIYSKCATPNHYYISIIYMHVVIIYIYMYWVCSIS